MYTLPNHGMPSKYSPYIRLDLSINADRRSSYKNYSNMTFSNALWRIEHNAQIIGIKKLELIKG